MNTTTTEITVNELRERDRLIMSDGSLAEVTGILALRRNRVHVIVRGRADRLHDEVLPGDARVRVAGDRPALFSIATF